MRKLIHDLLEYSRTGNEPIGDKVGTDANLVLGLALQQLQSRIEESGAKIRFDQLPVVVVESGSVDAGIPKPDRQCDQVLR